MEHHKKQKGIEKLETKAKSLVDLIDYQQDSVVSQEIISKKTGTITLFGFL
jgi:hypothetical protein